MKKLHFFTLAFLGLAGVTPVSAQSSQIDILNIDLMSVNEAARMISFITGESITPTSKSRDVECSVLIRNASIEEVISKLCVSSGLVYRKDNVHGGYLIMSLEEYQQNIIVDGGEKIRVYDVEPANVTIIAESIQALYPFDAILEESEGILDFSQPPSFAQSGGSGGGGRGSGGTGGFASGGGVGGGGSFGRGQNSRSVGGGGFGGQAPSGGNNLGAITAVANESTAGDPDAKEKTPSGSSIYVTTNIEHSSIVIRTANVDALDAIDQLVKRLDRPVSQVLLEMTILNLNIGDELNSGVNWSFADGNDLFQRVDNGDGTFSLGDFIGRRDTASFDVGSVEAASFVYNFLSEDISARLQLLSQDNRVEVLATPRLVATNNREAEIVVGEERILRTGASSDTNVAGDNGTTNTRVNITTESRTIGTTLRVIPRINSNETVTMHVEQESSSIDNSVANTIPVSGPNGTIVDVPIDTVTTSSISASVVAQDHNTIAVGGLIRNESSKTKNKVPVLGDVPILGRAFRSDGETDNKTELILLITPHIMDAGARGTAVTQSMLQEDSDHSYVRSGAHEMNQRNRRLQEYRNRIGTSPLPRKPNTYQPVGSKSSQVYKANYEQQQRQYSTNQQTKAPTAKKVAKPKQVAPAKRSKFFGKRKR